MTIDNGDTEPRFTFAKPGPQFMAFQSDSREVGKLWFDDPMRFEGDAEASANIFFDYAIKINNQALIDLGRVLSDACDLLNRAKCPNTGCVNGVCQDGPDEIYQCQFCYERQKIVAEHG